MALSEGTGLSRLTRAAGENLGFTYPDEPVEVSLRGPTPVSDYLTPLGGGLEALPHIMDPLEGVQGLDEIQISMIEANHKINLEALQGYHKKIGVVLKSFYDGVTKSSLALDNNLQLTSEMLSHVDGSI